MNYLLKVVCLVLCLNLSLSVEASEKDNGKKKLKYKTENVIIIVIDGPRFTETWGAPQKENIPFLANQFVKEGTVCTNFINDGPTYTISGHTTIATGYREKMDNGGKQLPSQPSIFQLWLQSSNSGQNKAWIVASKGKLNVLGNCKDKNWKNKFQPSLNCGVDGNGNGYREDSLTLLEVNKVMQTHQPQLMLINFRAPDTGGHDKNWAAYIKGIKDTDRYTAAVWELINSCDFYKGKTTVFVTNDHGRHLDHVADGFVSHGDKCAGCKHITLFAAGPDFKKNQEIKQQYFQKDIAVTIGELMGFQLPEAEGKIMWELFE